MIADTGDRSGHTLMILLHLLLLLGIFKLNDSIERKYPSSPPIMYLYVIENPSVCDSVLSDYISHALHQAKVSNPHSDVIFGTNILSCSAFNSIFQPDYIADVILIDITPLKGEKTLQFESIFDSIIKTHDDSSGKQMFKPDLWLYSALRFFIMEDIMSSYNISSIIHVEADNMLYGDTSLVVNELTTRYNSSLVATPLNTRILFITASILWVPSVSVLKSFNDFIIELVQNKRNLDSYGSWTAYMKFLLSRGGKKKDGTVSMYAINEMSMLAFYREMHMDRFLLFPVIPHYQFPVHKFFANLNLYVPNKGISSDFLGTGLFDAGSYGQYLDGTHALLRPGFSDGNHIAGLAMRVTNGLCTVKMLCTNTFDYSSGSVIKKYPYQIASDNKVVYYNSCHTAPFVKCYNSSVELENEKDFPKDEGYFPLWNLHVHSKRTNRFLSQSCAC